MSEETEELQLPELLAGFFRIVSLMKNAAPRIVELDTEAKRAIKSAVKQGWFFGWYDSLEALDTLVREINVRNGEAIDEVMAAYYRREMDWMLGEIISSYPERKMPIEAAAYAHKHILEYGFWLSIPVFIAQADGVLAELSSRQQPLNKPSQLFKHQRGGNERLDTLLRGLDVMSSSPLLHSIGERKRSGKPFNDLNRHVVAHGVRSEYGSEINSLKAFSFLAYVCLHVPLVLEEYVPRQH